MIIKPELEHINTQVNSVFYIKNDDYLNSIINSHNLVFDDDKVNNRCKEDFLCLKEFIKNDFGNSIMCKNFFHNSKIFDSKNYNLNIEYSNKRENNGKMKGNVTIYKIKKNYDYNII